MVKSKYFFTAVFFIVANASFAQLQTYFVKFKDKSTTAFSVAAPTQFLTAKAIQRRQKCGIILDEKDLPVSQASIDLVQSTGAQALYPLKWLNGVVVKSDATVKSQIAALSCVASVGPSVKSRQSSSSGTQQELLAQASLSSNAYANRQNDMLEMVDMNQDGYTGSGVLIAITDDGFLRADTMKAFAPLFANHQIKDTWDLVDLDKDVYQQAGSHGTFVFSILAGYLNNQLEGPGRGADFILFRTEDGNSETPLEEFNWIRAAEIADSMGADIIQLSLGYNTFDDASLNYTTADLDGKTSYISQGSAVAATRGIVVVVSAGNYGNNSWGKLLCPADAKGVLTVGSVDLNEQRAATSSVGYSADGRVKPDVMAMGANATYANIFNGGTSIGSGTSFASPLVSGLCAGLMQAYPALTHEELIRVVQYSADRFETPDAYYGYGIPHYKKAFDYARLVLDKEGELVFPNPFSSQLYVKIRATEVGQWLHWQLYTTKGELVEEGDQLAETNIVRFLYNGEALPSGLYCLKISGNDHFSTFKVIK
jgi:serine protease AprX